MSRTFNPRDVGKDAWKTWHKDSVRLMGRLGVVVVALWCVLAAGLVAGLHRMVGSTPVFLVALLALQILALLLAPFFYAAMDQLAEGQRLNIAGALHQACQEIHQNRGWYLRRAGIQVLLFLVAVALIVVLALVLSRPETAPEAATPANPFNPLSSMMMFFVTLPVFFRSNGVMSFDYWLETRHGLDHATSDRLQSHARLKNLRCMATAAFSMIALFIFFGYFPLASLVVLPILQWYHAAYTRCAYNDIFEDGAGLKAPVAATVHETHASPVLQA